MQIQAKLLLKAVIELNVNILKCVFVIFIIFMDLILAARSSSQYLTFCDT